jgi:hypothetical protein
VTDLVTGEVVQTKREGDQLVFARKMGPMQLDALLVK